MSCTCESLGVYVHPLYSLAFLFSQDEFNLIGTVSLGPGGSRKAEILQRTACALIIDCWAFTTIFSPPNWWDSAQRTWTLMCSFDNQRENRLFQWHRCCGRWQEAASTSNHYLWSRHWRSRPRRTCHQCCIKYVVVVKQKKRQITHKTVSNRTEPLTCSRGQCPEAKQSCTGLELLLCHNTLICSRRDDGQSIAVVAVCEAQRSALWQQDPNARKQHRRWSRIKKLTHNLNPHVACQGLLFFILP